MLALGYPNESQLKTVLADHELMFADNVLNMPHKAYYAKITLQRIVRTTIINL